MLIGSLWARAWLIQPVQLVCVKRVLGKLLLKLGEKLLCHAAVVISQRRDSQQKLRKRFEKPSALRGEAKLLDSALSIAPCSTQSCGPADQHRLGRDKIVVSPKSKICVVAVRIDTEQPFRPSPPFLRIRERSAIPLLDERGVVVLQAVHQRLREKRIRG